VSKGTIALKAGICTGRVAININMGFGFLTGIDVSPKTLLRAKENLLCRHNNVELLFINRSDVCVQK